MNFLTDALGSAIAVTDSGGSINTSYTYEPFGNVTVSGTNSNPYSFDPISFWQSCPLERSSFYGKVDESAKVKLFRCSTHKRAYVAVQAKGKLTLMANCYTGLRACPETNGQTTACRNKTRHSCQVIRTLKRIAPDGLDIPTSA